MRAAMHGKRRMRRSDHQIGVSGANQCATAVFCVVMSRGDMEKNKRTETKTKSEYAGRYIFWDELSIHISHCEHPFNIIVGTSNALRNRLSLLSSFHRSGLIPLQLFSICLPSSYIISRYAYGAVGMKGAIPPSSTLRFHLWLVELVWPHEVRLK